jgi:APA family basic amino acid/polyamine antiporter
VSSTLSPSGQLVRGLTLVAAVAVIVSNVIGTGVFLKARVMTCNVGSPEMVTTVWVVAGLLSLAGALTYAELGAMMPRAGGEVNYLGAAYGERWGFLYGWMQLLVGKTGSQAAVAVAFASALAGAMGAGWGGPLLAVGGFELTGLQLVAVALIALVTLVNLASVATSGRIATALTGVKVALVVGVAVAAFTYIDGTWGHFGASGADGACAGVAPSARLGVGGFGAAMLAALWGYDGWNNMALVAGEVKDPGRNIPRGLFLGVGAVLVLYVFVNVAYFFAMSPLEIASVDEGGVVAIEVMRRVVGPLGVSVMAAGLMASSFGTLHSSMLSGARIPYRLAEGGLLPGRLATLTPRTRVPVWSVVAQGAWASVLALSGSFDALTDYVIFGSWIFYGLTISAVFVLRRTMPDAERPYRAWGYPVVPALFLLVTAFLLVNTVITSPVQSLVGLGLIALGLPVYAVAVRRRGVAPV